MKSLSIRLALAASIVAALAASTHAQNPAHAPSDLVVTFQNPGGTQGATATVIAVAGATGTTAAYQAFRDAAPGSFTNLTNLDAALEAAFGTDWQNQTTLWMAGLGNRGTSDTSPALTQLDPQRTDYFTRARLGVGTVGLQNSVGYNLNPSANFNPVSNGMAGIKAQLEAQAGAVPVFTSTTTVSSIDDQLPTTAGGVQGAAFTIINDGIQGNFGPGSFGTFGAAGEIELALDLFRAQPRNDIAGQYGFNAPTGEGQFLGTLTINANGDLGFVAAVPEPSAGLLMGLTGLFAATLRRRKATV